MKVAVLVSALLATIACGKHGAAARGSPAEAIEEADGAVEPMDARETAAWARARDGDDGDLARLVDLVGCVGLRERASDARLRGLALRAMAFCPDFSELPWLVDVAATGRDAEASAALEAIVEQAARPRRWTDPEDALELGSGCRSLLAFSRDASRPGGQRAQAVRALRMLADHGCVKRADIPTAVDAR